MKRTFIFSIFIITSLSVFCKEVELLYNVLLIPDSLTKNAFAVVRENDIKFEYETLKKGTYTEKEVITVLKERGKSYANFHYPGDKYRTLADFSGKIYDAMGNLVSKIKKSDVQSTQWSQYLASDDLNYFYTCEPSSYPFTVVYEYTVDFKNGILSFPPFFPQRSSDISVQSANYTLVVPQNTKIISKNFNIAPFEKSTNKNSDSYSWKVKNLKAIEDEPYMPHADSFLPLVYMRPQNFIYDDVAGEITDWNSMGKWESSLLNGRQVLTDATKAKIKELTARASTDKEKVKILYDYLGQTTHYQNISLGIGGYQPMPAAEVCKVGFGDCKGLTNYLRAMLQSIGIKSYYTTIRMSEELKNVYTDFANFNQFNHIILQVPLQDETLWLECTNPEVPFGFIHNGIAGHQALVETENGGNLVRLPDYPDSLNVDKNIAEIKLSADGKAEVKTTNTFYVKKYDDYSYFTKLKHSEQIDLTRKFINLPTANISNVSYTEDKSALPSISVLFDWSTPLYGNKTGTRLFIPVNPLRKSNEKLKKNKRIFDIEIMNGYVNEDSLLVEIPDNFEIEGMPSPVNYTCPFGSFSSKVNISGNKINIYQKFTLNHGYWKAEKYQSLLDLFDKVSAGYKSKIILKSK
ncbi:Transglutaminase Domain-Containing Protein [uncultured Paludibacter sp.]|uniref:Transglutaminase Domain-Containing Protein n=1 Tax=uncultured Paludibacter sp. TaxID=497635 RepID=A0A653A5P3_9BACT|nr:Transglutaminase Domain-Containing Protein [uncultured Paludibacter sp.]